MSGDVIVVAEHREGSLKKTALEATTAARRIAAGTGGKVVALVLAGEPVGDAGTLGRFGADELTQGCSPGFESPDAAVSARAVADLARSREAAAVLLSASPRGKDMAPRIGALLGVPQASDCVDVRMDGATIHARRPVYAGKAFWTVTSSARPFLATLRPNAITPEEIQGADLTAADLEFDASVAPRLTLKEVIQPESKKVELAEADIVVSGGRGLKEPENFRIIEQLAEALGAAVGASRAVVDAGWRPHSEQVGQTGKVVAPTLYIAAGISGAIQHLAGMSSSRVIVAINKDAEAPIFKVANYGVVGDAMELVPALTEALKSG